MGCLHPLQTAIKCSVLRKWPIESMCVCFTWRNKRPLLKRGRTICVYGDKANKYTLISVHFLPTWMNPAELECHNIVLKGIVFFFLSPLRWIMPIADIFRISIQTGIKLRESIHVFFFAVNSLKVQCSAYASCVYAFHMESAVIISYCMCLSLQ